MDFSFFNPYSYIRILHAVPDAPAVDVYADNIKIASNLPFKNLTDYLRVRSGRYMIKIFPAGETQNPVLRRTVNIQARSILTIAATGKLENIDLLSISDYEHYQRRNAFFRVIHLSPDAPAVSVRLDGRTLYRNIRFEEINRYIPVNPATYTLNIFTVSNDQRVLKIPNIVLQDNLYYTAYILGLVEGNPSLQVITVIDGII